MLSPHEVKSLVEAWAVKEMVQFQGWRITAITKRQFWIKWKHPEFDNDFHLISGKILSDHSIRVFKDHRAFVVEMLKTPQGFEREARFFKALAERTPGTPKWFIKVERADTFREKMGIDGFAKMSVLDDTIKIPFQIKSSRIGREKFLKAYPRYQGIVEVVYVRDLGSDDTLRQQIYSMLGAVRSRILKGNVLVPQMKQKITEALYPRRFLNKQAAS